jgi:hypothetical protein
VLFMVLVLAKALAGGLKRRVQMKWFRRAESTRPAPLLSVPDLTAYSHSSSTSTFSSNTSSAENGSAHGSSSSQRGSHRDPRTTRAPRPPEWYPHSRPSRPHLFRLLLLLLLLIIIIIIPPRSPFVSSTSLGESMQWPPLPLRFSSLRAALKLIQPSLEVSDCGCPNLRVTLFCS